LNFTHAKMTWDNVLPFPSFLTPQFFAYMLRQDHTSYSNLPHSLLQPFSRLLRRVCTL
jgi:hypothetical protein